MKVLLKEKYEDCKSYILGHYQKSELLRMSVCLSLTNTFFVFIGSRVSP
jgi:hypothetical protein